MDSFFKLPELSFLIGHISSRNVGRDPLDDECLVLGSVPGTEKELHKSQLIPSREKGKLAQEGGHGGWCWAMLSSS